MGLSRGVGVYFALCIFAAAAVCVATGASYDEAKLKAFESWYEEFNPGAMKGLRLRRPGEGGGDAEGLGEEQHRPGIVSSSGFEVGNTVVQIPADFMITLHVVEESDVGILLTKINQRWGFGLMYDPVFYESLTMFILHEKFFNPESFWKPFLDLLPEPEEMDNALFWSAAELQLLSGSSVRQRIMVRRAEVRDNFNWLQQNVFRSYPEVFGERGPTEAQYRWAVAVVRSFNLQTIQYGELIPAICPLFSMFRLTGTLDLDEEPAWDFPEETETLSVFSRDAVAAGGEVFIPKAKANSELLDFYGFVRPDNMDDVVHVDVELSQSDPLAKQKQIMFKQADFNDAEIKITRRGITKELETTLRIATVSKAELTSDMLISGMPEYSLGDMSDYLIANGVLSLCQRYYSKTLPSSDAQDQRLLERTEENRPEGRDPEETDGGFETSNSEHEHAYHWPLTARERMAVLNRVGERETVRRIGAAYFARSNQIAEAMRGTKGSTAEDDEGGDYDEL